MEEIKLKPKFEAKLIELGVYEKWVENWKNLINKYSFNNSIEELNSYNNFRIFIENSFSWVRTHEKFDFWKGVSLAECEPPKSQLQILKEWIEENEFSKVELLDKIEEIEKL